VVQLGELREYYAEFQKAGVGVYAVSVDPPEQNARLKARLGAGYEFLSDERGELLDALDIRQAHRSVTGKDTAIPTQYLVDRDGIVRWVYRAETWRVRPHPREALQAIRELHHTAAAAAVDAAESKPAELSAADVTVNVKPPSR
jgi:peroxiredoxin